MAQQIAQHTRYLTRSSGIARRHSRSLRYDSLKDTDG